MRDFAVIGIARIYRYKKKTDLNEFITESRNKYKWNQYNVLLTDCFSKQAVRRNEAIPLV